MSTGMRLSTGKRMSTTIISKVSPSWRVAEQVVNLLVVEVFFVHSIDLPGDLTGVAGSWCVLVISLKFVSDNLRLPTLKCLQIALVNRWMTVLPVVLSYIFVISISIANNNMMLPLSNQKKSLPQYFAARAGLRPAYWQSSWRLRGH